MLLIASKTHLNMIALADDAADTRRAGRHRQRAHDRRASAEWRPLYPRSRSSHNGVPAAVGRTAEPCALHRASN